MFERGGVAVVCDDLSLEFLKGATGGWGVVCVGGGMSGVKWLLSDVSFAEMAALLQTRDPPPPSIPLPPLSLRMSLIVCVPVPVQWTTRATSCAPRLWCTTTPTRPPAAAGEPWGWHDVGVAGPRSGEVQTPVVGLLRWYDFARTARCLTFTPTVCVCVCAAAAALWPSEWRGP